MCDLPCIHKDGLVWIKWLTRFPMVSDIQATSEPRSQVSSMDAVAERQEQSALAGHPCWELAQRIIASPRFSKSERLSSFLILVCRLSLEGQSHKINEQYIGIAVFGRKDDYDTAVDGIVRTHASRLRQRLEQYFEEDGQHETLRVEIPPGSYVPIFSPCKTIDPVETALADSGPAVVVPLPPEPAIESISETVPERASRRRADQIRRISILIAFAWMALSIGYLATHPRLATAIRAAWIGSHHPLWSRIFSETRDTSVVAGDMALVNFENQTGRSVMLGEYTRDTYVSQYMNQFALESFSPSSVPFLTKTMTVVDSQFIERLLRSPGINLDRTRFISARDVQLPNLQSGNIVLLGNFRFNPWVQAFEPKMNFYFADSGSELTNSVLMNRSPRSNEQASYSSTDVNHVHTEYSIIAFQPNLSGSGNALLLEGQSQSSTEAAEQFVQNDVELIAFLNKIRRKDGSIPHFELLLKVKGMSGNSASYETLAQRVDD